MKNTLIALLAATIFAVVLAPIPAAAQAPVCANGADTDPDGDGWGWENGQSCIVADEPAPEPEPEPEPTPAPTPEPTTDPNSGCDYSNAHQNGGWGWNLSTNESCPPVANDPATDNPATDSTTPEAPQSTTVNASSDPSEIAAAIEAAGPTPPLVNINISPMRYTEAVVNGAVELEWTTTTADGFLIERNGEVYANATGDGFVDTQVEPGQTYSYRITSWVVVTENGTSTFHRGASPTRIVTVPSSNNSDGQPAPTGAETNTNTGCDYSNADQNGGWGWNPTTGTSCPPADNQPNPQPNPQPEPTPEPDPANDPDLAPVQVAATATDKKITLDWSTWVARNATNVDGYRIVRNGSFLATGYTTETSYTDFGMGIIGFGARLTPATTYSYEISSFKQDGDNAFKRVYGEPAIISVTTADEVPPADVPGAVDRLVATRQAGAGGEITFSIAWAPPPGADETVAGYLVRRNGGKLLTLSTPDRDTVRITDPAATTFTDGPFRPGDAAYDRLAATPPTYEVTAFNAENAIGPGVSTTAIVFYGDAPLVTTPTGERDASYGITIARLFSGATAE